MPAANRVERRRRQLDVLDEAVPHLHAEAVGGLAGQLGRRLYAEHVEASLPGAREEVPGRAADFQDTRPCEVLLYEFQPHARVVPAGRLVFGVRAASPITLEIRLFVNTAHVVAPHVGAKNETALQAARELQRRKRADGRGSAATDR